jgi:hypothetical protein
MTRRFLALSFLLIVLLIVGEACISKATKDSATPSLSYTVLDQKILDEPIKTSITLHVSVSGDITKESLTKLLNNLYAQSRQRTGFKYHTHPTNASIAAYLTKELYDSGEGLWIAMLNDDNAPLGQTGPAEIKFDEKQIAQLGETPEEKFGLSEEKRRQIYKEIASVEDKVAGMVDQKYPLPEKKVTSEKYQALLEQRNRLEESLTEKYKIDLAKKYKLSPQQLNEIAEEGFSKRWALPKPQTQ